MTTVRWRSNLPLLTVFLVLLAWSSYAYLAVRVNADIVAEAIQVQRWLDRPFWVWSYPGQLHGGVIEYPLIALAEVIAPGNVYGFTLVRVLYVPIAGVLVALALRRAVPDASLWPFAVLAATGPAVLHGFRLISDIYPSSILLACLGVYLLVLGQCAGRGAVAISVAGLVSGLAIYQHASAALLVFPFLAFVAVRWWPALRVYVWWLLGLVIGLIPMALGFFAQPDVEVVYRPTREGLPDVLGVLGLDSSATGWRAAMVPNGMGFAGADATIGGWGPGAQVWVNVVALLLVITTAIVGIRGLLRIRRRDVCDRDRCLDAVGVMWLVALLCATGFALVVPPIWYYGTPLGVLVWFTGGFALLWWGRRGWIAIGGVALVSAGYSAGQVWNSHPRFLTGIQVKAAQVAEVREVAQGIADGGVTYVFGDYWEVLPIAYASSLDVRPITYNFNRFPLPNQLRGQSIDVAVTNGRVALPFGQPMWETSQKALDLVEALCVRSPDLSSRMPTAVTVWNCPVNVLMEQR